MCWTIDGISWNINWIGWRLNGIGRHIDGIFWNIDEICWNMNGIRWKMTRICLNINGISWNINGICWKSMEYVGLSMGHASLKGTRSPGLQQPRLKATFTQQDCWTADAIILGPDLRRTFAELGPLGRGSSWIFWGRQLKASWPEIAPNYPPMDLCPKLQPRPDISLTRAWRICVLGG